MNFVENILNAFTVIRTNKMRSFLTTLGIVIGVFSVTVMVSLGESAQKEMTSGLEDKTNLLKIRAGNSMMFDFDALDRTPKQPKDLTNSDVLAIENNENILSISPELSSYENISSTQKNINLNTTGVLPEYLEVAGYKLKIGSFINQQNQEHEDKVVVLGSKSASNLFGDENPLGKNVKIKNSIFKVIGVLDKKEGGGWEGDLNDVVLIPLSTAQNRVFGKKTLSSISVLIKDEVSIKEAKHEIIYALLREHKITDVNKMDFSVFDNNEMIKIFDKIKRTMTLFLAAIGGISLLVGGIGVMNIMLVSVTERTREIGIRKAVGAQRRSILLQFLTESIFLSIVGGLIGVLLSYVLIVLVRKFSTFDVVFSTNAMLISLSFSFFVGIFFGSYPANKASKLKPIDALRFE